MGEANFVSVQVLDDLVNDLFSLHFIEPIITFTERIKIRKAIQKLEKPKLNIAQSQAYMRPLQAKQKL